MWFGVTERGMTERPRCKCQRKMTCAAERPVRAAASRTAGVIETDPVAKRRPALRHDPAFLHLCVKFCLRQTRIDLNLVQNRGHARLGGQTVDLGRTEV